MGLNLSNSTGSEYLRWMASRSEWVMSTENGPEIVELKKAVFDVGNLRTGWASMAPETAPEFVWDPSITKAAPRPATPGEWKRAFECKVFADNALGGVKIWSSNSTGACMGIDALDTRQALPVSRGKGVNNRSGDRCFRVHAVGIAIGNEEALFPDAQHRFQAKHQAAQGSAC